MPHLSWSSVIYLRDLTFHGFYSPHITHTQTYSHTGVFAPPNLLVRCHLSLMALFRFAFSAYVQHRARGLVTARRVRGIPTTSIPTGTGARWTIPGVPPLKPIYGHVTCGICRLQVVIHPSFTPAVCRAGSGDPLLFGRDEMWSRRHINKSSLGCALSLSGLVFFFAP